MTTGVVRRVSTPPRAASSYDPRLDDHHHVICRSCGARAGHRRQIDTDARRAGRESRRLRNRPRQLTLSGLSGLPLRRCSTSARRRGPASAVSRRARAAGRRGRAAAPRRGVVPAEQLLARAVQHAAGVDDVVGRVEDAALVQAVGERGVGELVVGGAGDRRGSAAARRCRSRSRRRPRTARRRRTRCRSRPRGRPAARTTPRRIDVGDEHVGARRCRARAPGSRRPRRRPGRARARPAGHRRRSALRMP